MSVAFTPTHRPAPTTDSYVSIQQIDQIYMERAERERSAARLEGQISDLQKAAEARIASLPPAEAADYRRLQAENAALSKDIEAKQSELEAANREVRVSFRHRWSVQRLLLRTRLPLPSPFPLTGGGR